MSDFEAFQTSLEVEFSMLEYQFKRFTTPASVGYYRWKLLKSMADGEDRQAEFDSLFRHLPE